MRGWAIDCYPEDDHMVMWFRTNSGPVRRVLDMRPSFLVHASRDDLDGIRERFLAQGVPTSYARARTELGGPLRRLLQVTPRRHSDLERLARDVDRWGGHQRHELYDVDLRMDQRLYLGAALFPFGLLDLDQLRMLDSPHRIDYPVPNLTQCILETRVDSRLPSMDDRLREVVLDDDVLDGPEDQMILDLMQAVRQRDPDVIRTTGGDRFMMHHLEHRAQLHGLKLELGRDPGRRAARGRSYFTYGRIVYKPPAYKLRGRLHIDTNSFMHSEGGMHGLMELSRLSRINVQDLSRMSPGSAISAMQVNRAKLTGHVIRWKKNRPEDFKTAAHLVVCDRGGMIFNPEVGVHDRVAEVDFSSMYPSIMVRYNISPETMLCGCCPASTTIVPELGYHICERRTGLLPTVLEPIIQRRRAFKRMVHENPSRAEVYQQRSKLLKWLLVTCFGYTGYKNARFGRIECHEAITAYGREILLSAAEMAESRGLEVLHGIVDSLWLKGDGDVEAFCEDVGDRYGIPLELEGRYRWIVFLPAKTTGIGALNRYYGLFDDGELKVRGVALRRRDTPELVNDLQRDMLAELSRAEDADSLRDRVPDAMDVLHRQVAEVDAGGVELERLVLTRRASKGMRDYHQFNDSVAAMRQLAHHGVEVHPGEKVKFVVTDAGSCDPWQRVVPMQLLDGSERYDAERYISLLIRAAEELLLPFGWNEATISSSLPR